MYVGGRWLSSGAISSGSFRITIQVEVLHSIAGLMHVLLASRRGDGG